MWRVIRARRLILVAVVLLAVAALAPAGHAAFPGRNGQIAFVHSESSDPETGNAPSHHELSLMAGEPFGRDRFTLRSCRKVGDVPQGPECVTSFTNPAYSADGQRIVVDAGKQLATMASDGSDFRLLPPQTLDDSEPSWNRTGRRIVFSGLAPGATKPELYVLDLATGTSRKITTASGAAPAWSVRNRIAFVRNGQLLTVDPDGSTLRRITRKGGSAPAWSPHGTKIAFVRKGRLHVYSLRTRSVRKVGGRNPLSATDVAWSPNGRWFAYNAFESGIWIARTDGSGEREFEPSAFSHDGGYDAFQPDWRPLPR
jgi:WD40 repeat protein